MQLFTALLSALALVSSTTALPAPADALARRSAKIVINPPILSPSKGATWKIGSTQRVTWQTSVIPPEGQNNTGHIVLGFDDGTGSENLQFSKFSVLARRPRPPLWRCRCRCSVLTSHLRRHPPCNWLFVDEREPSR